MDNKFFKFVKAYWEDISELLDSIYEMFKALYSKLGSSDSSDAE